MNAILKKDTVRDLIMSQGNEVGGGTPEEFAALVKSESLKWTEVIKKGNIKPD